MNLEQSLKEYFGYNTFRANQKEIVSAILENKDVLAILPTGAGKSLCYQLPAVILPGTAIVVSPLISLMQDQVDSLSKNGISAAYINSSLHFHDMQDIVHALSQYKILFVAPERFSDKNFIAKLKQTTISIIVIDEAHCISQWGHSFRPEYRQLSFLKETFQRPVLALTATATSEVERDIVQQMAMKDPFILKASFDRPNLTIRINQRSDQEKQLKEFLNLHKGQSGIIYCSTRKNVEAIYNTLSAAGLKPGKYHAGMPDHDRATSQKAFIHDEIQLMVATVAFGMGIHKPDVRFIVHVDMPRTIEQYYQEIGRAGRDGLPAECLMLYSTKDLMVYKSFQENDSPEHGKSMGRKTELMYRLCTSSRCRRAELLRYFGETSSFSSCQSCDNCVDDVNLIEGVVIAQKILSCVYRLNQKFGIRYVIDVLRGAKTKQVFDHRHDELSTYNLMPECSEQELRYYIENLIEMNHLQIAGGDYPLLQWTTSSMEVVKGNVPIKFKKKVFKEGKRQPGVGLPAEYDAVLFRKLQVLRRELAQKEGVPPYVVFSDRSLAEICVHYPQTQSEFTLINGVGPIKWHKYGREFAGAVAKHCEENAIFNSAKR